MDKKNFKTLESLQPVINVLNESNLALQNAGRTIKDSEMANVLHGVLGFGIGGTVGVGLSFTALYTAGITGISAVGITSGLAAIGIGGMIGGIFTIAGLVAVPATIGVMIAMKLSKDKKLKYAKENLLNNAIEVQDTMSKATKIAKERFDYLNSLDILLSQAIKDLKEDLE